MAMTEFRVRPHVLTGMNMVEVWINDVFVCSIYGKIEGDGIRILSRHLDDVVKEEATADAHGIPGVVMNFKVT